MNQFKSLKRSFYADISAKFNSMLFGRVTAQTHEKLIHFGVNAS